MKYNEIAVDDSVVEALRSEGYAEDLLPNPQSGRIWNTHNYFTLWMGTVHNVPNYVAVGGFLFLGLSPVNVMLALFLSAFAISALMIANGAAGYKYGIPFSILLKESYGKKGAILPGFLRGCIAAIMWYGLQTYSGSQGMMILIGKLWPGFLEVGGGVMILGLTIPGLIAFIAFWGINMAVALGGKAILSKFLTVLNPLIYLVFGGMVAWSLHVAGGLGPILSYSAPATGSGSPALVYIMIISSVLSVWGAPGVSASDFTRYAITDKAQKMGQFVGFIFSYALFAVSSVCILVGASIHYNTQAWNVLEIIDKWDNLPAAAFAILVLLMTTISTNATANIVPAGYQIATIFEKRKLDYRTGVVIAAMVAALIMPWKLMENSTSIYAFLEVIGSVVGPVAGVMIGHYYYKRRRTINLKALYDPSSDQYPNGVNAVAYLTTIIGLFAPSLLAMIPGMAWIRNLSWIVGFGLSFGLYVAIPIKIVNTK